MEKVGRTIGLTVAGSELRNRDGCAHQISHSLRPMMLEPAIVRLAVPEFAEQRVLAKVIDVPVHVLAIGNATLMPRQAFVKSARTACAPCIEIPTLRERVPSPLAIECDAGRLREVEDEDVNAGRLRNLKHGVTVSLSDFIGPAEAAALGLVRSDDHNGSVVPGPSRSEWWYTAQHRVRRSARPGGESGQNPA